MTSMSEGAPDAAALPALKARAFSRDATDDDRAAYLALESALAADAVTRARAAYEAPDARPDPPAAEPPATSAAPAPAAEPPAPTAELWRRRSQLWMRTAIATGILLLAGAGLVAWLQLGPGPSLLNAAGAGAAGAPDAATPTPTASAQPEGLTIFEDPSLAPSIPPQNIDPYYKPESLRLLGVADAELTVYAVENRTDQPCLLAVYLDGTQSATCVTKEEFATSGIQLRLTSLRPTSPNEGLPADVPTEDVVFWYPDGSYGATSG